MGERALFGFRNGHGWRAGLAGLLALGLSACAAAGAQRDWHGWAAALQAEGKLRQDRAPADAPFDAANLVQAFARIALSAEFQTGYGAAQSSQLEHGILRKWNGPVPIRLVASDADMARIEVPLRATLDRLEAATGITLPWAISYADPEQSIEPVFTGITIAFGPLEFLASWADAHAQMLSVYDQGAHAISADFRNDVRFWRRSASPCAFHALLRNKADGSGLSGVLTTGSVFIEADMPDLVLQTCLEEELSQVLGLADDHDQVRPSIYNDDQEFAFLTEHDALLLRILYDERLRPGMSGDVAMPIVQRIASELGAE